MFSESTVFLLQPRVMMFTFNVCSYLVREEAVDEFVGVEHLEVGHFFAQSDVADRYLELVADADDYAAFCGAVQFGEGKSVDISSGGELAGLLDGVLPGAGVEYKEDFMRCVGHEFLHHFLDFAQFIHEAYLVVESSGGVDKYHIDAL